MSASLVGSEMCIRDRCRDACDDTAHRSHRHGRLGLESHKQDSTRASERACAPNRPRVCARAFGESSREALPRRFRGASEELPK
eukprot:1228919-Alexandrium_andersonii.AAC.1